jgi:chromosome segregation ATPase
MSDEPMTLVLAALARLEAGQAKLEAGQASLEGRQAGLEAGQAKLRGDLMDRMDRLENNLTAIRDDIAVNHGTVDQVRRANDNTREELRSLGDVVMAMERQILRLKTDVEDLKGGKSK